MDVIFGVARDVEVDHVADFWDVQPPSSHIGPNQHLHPTRAERTKHLLPGCLVHVAMDSLRDVAPRLKSLNRLVDHPLGGAEDHGPLRLLDSQNPAQCVKLAVEGDQVKDLVGFRNGQRLGLTQADHLRVSHVAAGNLDDRLRHRRREQRRHAALRQVAQDVLDVLDEAHLEHLVGLVQDQQSNLGQVDRAAAHVVHQATRCGDDGVNAATQRTQLAVDRLAAVDRDDLDPPMLADLAKLLGDLDGQLARRHQDNRLRNSPIGVDSLDQRDPISRRLAGPG